MKSKPNTKPKASNRLARSLSALTPARRRAVARQLFAALCTQPRRFVFAHHLRPAFILG